MYTPDSPMGAGDRAPDFTLPDGNGAPINLYTRVRGGTPVLVFYPDIDSFAADAAELQNAVEPAGPGQVDLFAIVHTPYEALAEFAATVERSMFVVADPAGVAAKGFGFAAGVGPLTLRFDANLRLTALRAAGAEAVAYYVKRHLDHAAVAEQPRLVSALAPALVVPNVLSPDLCRELIDLHHSGGNEPSTVTYYGGGKDVREVHLEHKSRFDHVITDAAMNHRLTEILDRRLNFEIEKAFHFRVGAHDGFSVVRYDADTNGHFSLHRDNVTPTTMHFRFAVTINLNFGDYEGGLLRFPEYSADLYAPETGGAIVFSCSNLHEATPVTAGSRYALLTFVFGGAAMQPN